jgi:hypothetical protein
MATTIFLSWQSDTPTRDGRNFIERALETAIKNISNEIQLQEAIRDELEIDKDTKNVPGSPRIFETILRKIEDATIFVPDFTFVGRRKNDDPTPNPNVLIEYGYARKCKDLSQIMPVMNVAYGKPTRVTMPFDLLELRNPIAYDLPERAGDDMRTAQRALLVKDFETALRVFFASEDYARTLPVPVPVAYREPKDGMARFRAKGEPIGYMRDAMAQMMQLKGRPVYLANGTAAWLRLMPQNPVKPWELADVENLMVQLAVSNFYEAPEPPQKTRAIDGWGFCRTLRADDPATSLVFLFTGAEIWTINTFYANVRDDVIFVEENRFVQTLEFFVQFLGQRQVPPPYRWVAGIEGLLDRYLPSQYGVGVGPGPSAAKTVYEEGILKKDESAEEALNPFFTELYAAFGANRAFGRR